MRVPRSQISSALFTLLKGAYSWVTSDPRLMLGDDLSAFQQPAMFLVKPHENISQQKSFALPIYTLHYFCLVLVRAASVPEDSSNTAEDVMDDILDALEAALMPQPGQKQTLGGLVTHCWIDGDVQIDTPVLFEQAAIWIPITVLVGV